MCNARVQRRARAHPDEEHRLRRRAGRAARHGHARSSARCSRRSSRKKPALMDSNQKAVELGYDFAKAHFECPLPIHLQPMDETKDAILIDGNTAAALGCVYAGATVGAWYPITPSTSLMEAFKGFCQKYRRDRDHEREPVRHSAGRGRAGGDRHGDRRGLGRRAGVHADVRSGHLADERVHRPGLLRRGPGGDVRRAAHRAVDRHADAHAAGRPHDVRLRLARRHAAHLPLSRRSARGVRVRGARPSIWRSGSRRRCSCSATSTSA